MLKLLTFPGNPKTARTPQISTIIFYKCLDIPRHGVKRNLRPLKKQNPETPDIKDFTKAVFFGLKRGLKGVLRGLKRPLKKIVNFPQKSGFSQTRFLGLEVSG